MISSVGQSRPEDSRSNAATYIKVFSEIQDLFSPYQEAKRG
jgi:excinuclease UvrABC ATPase subunit